MKKIKSILIGILLSVALSIMVLANFWVSPTDYIDIGSAWTDELNTYDEDVETYADTLKTGIGNSLALTIPSALPCDRIRVFVADYKSGSFNPDILIRIKEDDETVTTIYDGIMNWGEWVEIEFSPKVIDVIYINANSLGGGHRLRVYEADFGDPSPSYGKVGAECNFDGDIGVPSGSTYYINEIALNLADLAVTDVTTNDVSVSMHGLAPKAPNDASKYLDGTGAWTVPAGGNGAPVGATYITQTTNVTLTAEQALINLDDGLLYVTGSTGVLTNATDANIKTTLVDEVTKTGTLVVGDLVKVNNISGVIEPAGVATETTLTTDSDAKIPTSKAVNTYCITTQAFVKSTMAADVDLNEHNILLEASLSSDHNYSGLIDSQLVGETVVFGQLLYFNWTDKEWKLVDADASATMPGLRIALEDKGDGQSCKMLVVGYIRDDSAFEFAGSMVYASCTPGAISSTAPSASGDQIQRVGVAKSADILFFYPSADVGEI